MAVFLPFTRLPIYGYEKFSTGLVLLRPKPKNKSAMDEEKKTDVKYQRYGDITAKVITQKGDANLRPMQGRILINSYENELNFREAAPRGPRSVEIVRTLHSRLVRRNDGGYTLTFRFQGDMKYMSSTLIAELRDAAKAVEYDKKKGKEVKE